MQCKLCDQEIDQERLEVLPETTLCFDCAKKSDKELRQELGKKTRLLQQDAQASHSISCQNGFSK